MYATISPTPKGNKVFSAIATGVEAVLITPASGRLGLQVRNTGDFTIYLGNDDVDDTSPVQLTTGETLTDTLTSDAWYAISPDGDSTLAVLVIEQVG